MDDAAIREAAALLVEARRSGRLLEALPPQCRVGSVAEAEAIQAAVVAALGEGVIGWKVATLNGALMGGAILASRVFPSPARIRTTLTPLRGVEAEIAFRFDRDLPARERDYGRDEVADAVTAMAAIEVVDSRFRDYRTAPLLDKAADCVSNGAFVAGTLCPGWRALDLVNLAVTLRVDGEVLVEKRGGHPAGDPLAPAIALVNARRSGAGVKTGQIMTTGTYTGLNFVGPSASVSVVFDGVGSAELQFTG
jgi:2-keto-4-pentenoate hydratase